jgi:hypothetical protein
MAAAPTLCDRRAWHNLKVSEKAAALRAAGFNVAEGVRIRLISNQGTGYAVADYLAAKPGARFIQIGEVKTGDATLTTRQRENYGNGGIQILSGNAGAVGLELGQIIPGVYIGEDRFPGCPGNG